MPINKQDKDDNLGEKVTKYVYRGYLMMPARGYEFLFFFERFNSISTDTDDVKRVRCCGALFLLAETEVAMTTVIS